VTIPATVDDSGAPKSATRTWLHPIRLARVRRDRDLGVAGLVLVGLALAVAVRVVVAGGQGARSVPAGVAFGLILLALAFVAGFERPSVRPRVWVWGLAGALVLCLPPLWHRLHAVGATSGGFAVWASVVTLVAVAEEVLLRGALFEAVTRWHGENTAITVSAVAFALLHVPIYGWTVLPLDLAVGVALGVLRVVSRSVTAPAVTHVVADLAGWWLR
jgi:membrane protease YdiL (CAAX protease family)